MFRHLYQSWLRLLKVLRLKRSEPVPLTAGVLIIASAQAVTAPIRYGRLSGKKRGHTYTMVFSRLCSIGQAKVVRCSNTVSSTADLIEEAEHLWKAEQPEAFAGRI